MMELLSHECTMAKVTTCIESPTLQSSTSRVGVLVFAHDDEKRGSGLHLSCDVGGIVRASIRLGSERFGSLWVYFEYPPLNSIANGDLNTHLSTSVSFVGRSQSFFHQNASPTWYICFLKTRHGVRCSRLKLFVFIYIDWSCFFFF